MATPAKVFQFCDQNEGKIVRWWPSVRSEVIRMAALLPLAWHDAGAPLAPLLFATDAEGDNFQDHGGYGVVGAKISEADAKRVFEAGTVPRWTVTRLNGSLGNLRDPAKELRARVPFSRVPKDLLAPHALEWVPLAWGRWKRPDPIVLGEGRGMLKLLEALAVWPGAHRSKAQSLQDNAAWAGAAAKGRSSAPAVNYLLRKKASISLAAGIELALPWTDTGRMPADAVSRYKGHRPKESRPRSAAQDLAGVIAALQESGPPVHHLGNRVRAGPAYG